ncbi:hypothetical protein D6C85_05824 [Aureobasidium pullulans]|uniref:Amidohydrolase-related domain-containing protein n=1 Tax=Aureobasidium pullulans TaxID=5580 RepID=A0A4S9WYN5_AURPU|nr:hypothetical protein D6C85_05824 [Aureobasidium pullulans]
MAAKVPNTVTSSMSLPQSLWQRKEQFLHAHCAKKNGVVLEAGIRSLKIASEAGVTVCFGTDLLGPLCPDTRVQHTLGSPFSGGLASYGNGQSYTYATG